FERSRTRKIFVEEDYAMDALVVEQPRVALRNIPFQFVGDLLVVIQVNGQDELFAHHGTFGPDVVRGKDAEFLYRQRFENRFDVLGVDVLPFLGDDHILLAAAEVEMPLRVQLAKIAGAKPAIHNGFGRQFGIVEVAGHDRLAAYPDFAHTVRGGLNDLD